MIMKFPKIRFTWGNMIAIATTAAGLIKEAAPQLMVLVPGTGSKIVAIGAVIGLVTKGALSFNHDQIPEENKVQAGPIMVEKTGPLKSDTP